MGKRALTFFILLFCLFACAFILPAAAASEAVYVIKLEKEVEQGLYRYLQRTIREANENGAAAIILEIDTPGGFVASAENIQKLIYDSVPVYAYVRYNALSAGAFIALSCDALFMAPGSTIGAAEVRTLTGGEVDQKIIKAWEGKMRTTAQRLGKDEKIAVAMTTESLTLTAAEAEEIGFADGVFADRSEIYDFLGLNNPKEFIAEITLAERLARFVTNPYVAPVILAVGITALVIEILVAGFGLPGIISILAFALFFSGHIFAGLAGREVIFLFIIGLILLLAEALAPGFGVLGIGGLVAVIASVILSAASTGQGVRTLIAAIVLTALVIAVIYRYLKKSPLWSQIVLQHAAKSEDGYLGTGDYSRLVGKEGVTLSVLRPAGLAEFDGERIDVVSEGSFIDRGVKVKVAKVEGTRVVVRPK
ncbi:MAG: nodulation protein NfeD [Bacillota bacterium]|jgi:membrane-bound serine protease (ClpP class)|nr:nodulation protein NfeD [Bacillota bacterium]HHU30080.1 nodulation protein NfeD [Bacillota bacterium]